MSQSLLVLAVGESQKGHQGVWQVLQSGRDPQAKWATAKHTVCNVVCLAATQRASVCLAGPAEMEEF